MRKQTRMAFLLLLFLFGGLPLAVQAEAPANAPAAARDAAHDAAWATFRELDVSGAVFEPGALPLLVAPCTRGLP